jgi:hypothetical protein
MKRVLVTLVLVMLVPIAAPAQAKISSVRAEYFLKT